MRVWRVPWGDVPISADLSRIGRPFTPIRMECVRLPPNTDLSMTGRPFIPPMMKMTCPSPGTANAVRTSTRPPRTPDSCQHRAPNAERGPLQASSALGWGRPRRDAEGGPRGGRRVRGTPLFVRGSVLARTRSASLRIINSPIFRATANDRERPRYAEQQPLPDGRGSVSEYFRSNRERQRAARSGRA